MEADQFSATILVVGLMVILFLLAAIQVIIRWKMKAHRTKKKRISGVTSEEWERRIGYHPVGGNKALHEKYKRRHDPS